jgi:hypothetical protein
MINSWSQHIGQPIFLKAGCLADDPIERAPQGDYEIREALK